jgi:hypothetical protein
MTAGQPVKIQFELAGSDLERLVVVGSDLEYLIGLPRDRLLTHTEVRLCAGVLRRLLIEGQLKQLWHTIGASTLGPPTVEATEIDTALGEWPTGWIRYAWAGGASAKGAHHTGVILTAVPKHEHERYGSPEAFFKAHPLFAEQKLPLKGERRRMTIDQWQRSTSVAIQTNEIGLVRISRAAVLTYVANRKGGVHFDPNRDLTLKKKGRKRREIESHLLDHGLLRVGHLSGPEFEVASMVQAIASSDWATEIVRVALESAPEDFRGDPNELKFWTGMKEADGTGWATSRFQPAEDAEGS